MASLQQIEVACLVVAGAHEECEREALGRPQRSGRPVSAISIVPSRAASLAVGVSIIRMPSSGFEISPQQTGLIMEVPSRSCLSIARYSPSRYGPINSCRSSTVIPSTPAAPPPGQYGDFHPIHRTLRPHKRWCQADHPAPP